MLRTGVLRPVLLFVMFLFLVSCSAGKTASPSASASPHAPSTVAATASVQATVSADKNTCFINPNGPSMPSVYAGGSEPGTGPVTAPAVKGTPVTLSDGLEYLDIKVGDGVVVKVGATIVANYTGWLASNCQKFDSSYDSHGGQPAGPLTIGLDEGQLIKGWVEGLAGMKVGGIRRLYVPAALGYGDQAQGPIPANSDMIFDVQIVGVQ